MLKYLKSKSGLRSIALTVLLALLTFVMVFIALSSLKEEAIKTHRNIAMMHARTFEEHLSSALEQIGHTLDYTRMLETMTHDSFSSSLNELVQKASYLRSLSLLDENGTIVASSFNPNKGIKIAIEDFLPTPFYNASILRLSHSWVGRDFYEALSSLPKNTLGVSFIPVLKRIELHEKSYHALASINTDYFINRFLITFPYEQGYVNIWRTDGRLLFSTHPNTPQHIESYRLNQKTDEDFFDVLTHSNQAPIHAIRLARFYPFIVEVRMDESNALGYWSNERGQIIWLSLFLTLLSGSLGLLLLIRSFRENARQKEQLAYEKQFRIAMEATQTGLWQWNIQTGEITWDPQCFYLLGYENEAFIPSLERIHTLTHPEDMAVFPLIKEKIAQDGTFMIERRMKHTQHEWVWIHVRGKVIEYTPEGLPLILIGVYINIDAQKKAEQMHLSAVAFETQEAILITDASETILKVNEAFTRITGYAEEEIIGKRPNILKSERHDKAFYEAMWKDLLEKGFWQGELWNKRKNGELYAEFLTITAIRDSSGNITHYLANFNDVTTHAIAQKEREELAFHDPLTQLGNRRLLEERFTSILHVSTQKREFGALLFLDLDFFKQLNDTYGHDSGDMLLIQVAKRLQENTRHNDLLIRLGGDEFVIVIQDLGKNATYTYFQTHALSQKILSRVCEPYPLAHGHYTIGASIGVTFFGDDSHKSMQEILKEADDAMYHAKQNGRNQISFFNPSLAQTVVD